MAYRLTAMQYDLFLTGTQKLAAVIPLVVMFAVPLLFYFVFTTVAAANNVHRDTSFFPYFPLIIFVGGGLFYCWTLAATPEQTVVFKSLFSERVVRPTDFISIEPRSLRVHVGISGYVLNHRDGKILYSGQFTGMHQLLTELKSANPGLEIRGC
jgi:hypothetical protein